MTKELLEDYPHICAEIKELERTVTDSVQGSMPDYPYTPRSITIQGLPWSNQEQIAFLRAQRTEIEEAVGKLPKSEWRRIVRLRAYRKLSWGNIAAKMGNDYTQEKARHKYRQALDYMKNN